MRLALFICFVLGIQAYKNSPPWEPFDQNPNRHAHTVIVQLCDLGPGMTSCHQLTEPWHQSINNRPTVWPWTRNDLLSSTDWALALKHQQLPNCVTLDQEWPPVINWLSPGIKASTIAQFTDDFIKAHWKPMCVSIALFLWKLSLRFLHHTLAYEKWR
jgi:hypothetical protein